MCGGLISLSLSALSGFCPSYSWTSEITFFSTGFIFLVKQGIETFFCLARKSTASSKNELLIACFFPSAIFSGTPAASMFWCCLWQFSFKQKDGNSDYKVRVSLVLVTQKGSGFDHQSNPGGMTPPGCLVGCSIRWTSEFASLEHC